MSIFFLILVLVLLACAAGVLLTEIILWYDLANRDPSLLERRFERGRLWFAIRLLTAETFCLFVTLLVHPFEWLRFGRDRSPQALSAATPVVLLHGLFHNPTCWWWVARRLRRRGVSVCAVNLPLWHAPSAAVSKLSADVDKLIALGAKRVNLAGHSTGGLVARQYLQTPGAAAKIGRCVLLGVPNEGSRLAPFALSPAGKALLPGSAYLRSVAGPIPEGVPIATIYSRHDSLVIPWESARLAGAKNLEVPGVGHTMLLYHPKAIAPLIAELTENP